MLSDTSRADTVAAAAPDDANFAAVFESSPTAMLLVRADPPRWTILAANAEYRRLTRKSTAELTGRGTFEAFPESHDTDLHGGQRNIRSSFERALTGTTVDILPVQRYDLPFATDSGGEFEERYWRLSSSAVRRGSGGLVLHQVENVTEQVHADLQRNEAVAAARTAEERLRTVFADAPVGFAVLRGPKHVFESVNAAYIELIGQRPLIGLDIRAAFPDLASQPIYDLLDQVYTTGIAYTANEMLIPLDRGRDGRLHDAYFNFVYQPLRDKTGAVEGIAVIVTSVTDFVTARHSADQAREEAENANRAKSEFLAAMSHELRTPLNAIIGYVELLEVGIGGDLTDQQLAYLGRVRRAQQVLARLIEDVLTFARIDAGRLRYNIESVPLLSLLSGMEALVAPQLGAKGLSYECCDVASDITVLADRDKAEQILLNLLSNAIKFTDTGGVHVDCLVREKDVSIDVRDTGRGIPADKLQAVFEPFVQLDSRLTRTQGGSGLGLAISRDLARAMAGSLTVTSDVGRGTTFTLTLPRVR